MKNKGKNFLSAVIYVHNAEDRIGEFLQTILHILEENFEHSEIICVNDCSEDNSVEKIKSVSGIAVSTSISVLNMSYFHGLEMAMNAGIDLSIGDFVFEFDSTVLDFGENTILEVYEKSLEGFDIVCASSRHKERFTSRMFYKIFDRFADFPYRMNTESFRILSRRVINRVSSMNKTVPYRKAIYANCGLKTDSVKYDVIDGLRARPDKKESYYRSGLAMYALLLFTKVGYQFSMLMTIVMMLISAFMVIYSIVIYTRANPVAGWTTTILFLSVAFFGLFGVLTIIIKYLQLLIRLVFKRKPYTFESIEKLTK